MASTGRLSQRWTHCMHAFVLVLLTVPLSLSLPYSFNSWVQSCTYYKLSFHARLTGTNVQPMYSHFYQESSHMKPCAVFRTKELSQCTKCVARAQNRTVEVAIQEKGGTPGKSPKILATMTSNCDNYLVHILKTSLQRRLEAGN